MEQILIFVLLGIGFLSFIPVLSLNKNKDNKKYEFLKYLINIGFVWTILIFLERLSGNMTVLYYAHILGFPIKFMLVSFMVCTIFNYIEKPMPKFIIYVLVFINIVEFVLAFTNTINQYLLQMLPSQINSYVDLYTAEHGPLFIYHLIILLLNFIFIFFINSYF